MSDKKDQKESRLLPNSNKNQRDKMYSNSDKHNFAPTKIRGIHPLGFRVVVRIEDSDKRSEGGLYLPEGAKESTAEALLAQVIEVASAIDYSTEESTNVSGVPHGAYVLIPKEAGIKIPWDDRLRIVDTKDVLAVIEEVSVV
ncbi:MAG: co-chaperone GroES [Bdellovibrionales bacterium]|nr:co-chaperone GroES [Bdellovibrionales bacterium]